MLKFFEIAEGNHLIHNPMTDAEMLRAGEYCQLKPGMRLLDLACGSGEMLCRYANEFGITGTGVDISEVFIANARTRAQHLNVADAVTFEIADGATYPQPEHDYDRVSCLGATWIGNGAVGTLDLMRPALKDPNEGILMVGEPFWQMNTPDTIKQKDPDLSSVLELEQLIAAFDAGGYQLVAMVDSTFEGWAMMESVRWQTAYTWLQKHPDHADAAAFKAWMREEQANYFGLERAYFGWSIFVLRPVKLW